MFSTEYANWSNFQNKFKTKSLGSLSKFETLDK